MRLVVARPPGCFQHQAARSEGALGSNIAGGVKKVPYAEQTKPLCSGRFLRIVGSTVLVNICLDPTSTGLCVDRLMPTVASFVLSTISFG